jgi:hypothetical protein
MGGGVGDTLTAQMQRDGAEVPEQISNVPKVTSDLLCYVDAFYELDTERNHGMGLVRIPWSSIVAYGDRYGYDVDELVFFIRQMDEAHIEKLRGTSGNAGSAETRTDVQRPPRPD